MVMEGIVSITSLKPWSNAVPSQQHTAYSAKPLDASPFPYNPDINERIVFWEGDITTLQVDAIVHSACESMTVWSSMSNRLHVKAGFGLREELNNAVCHPGEIILTAGHNLPARAIIHTVGPAYNIRYQSAAQTTLHLCYRNVLQKAYDMNFNSIAVCPINSVRLNFPPDEGAHIALRTIRRFLERQEECGRVVLKTVVIVTESVDTSIYEVLIPIYFPRSVDEEILARLQLSPDAIGGPAGEPIFPDRQIRIIDNPHHQLTEKKKSRILCLVFVQVAENGPEGLSGFCLLPRDDETLPLRKMLSDSGVQIGVHRPATPSPSARLKAMHTILDINQSNGLQVHCIPHQLQSVSKFFAPVSNAKFVHGLSVQSPSSMKTVLSDDDLKALEEIESEIDYGDPDSGILHLAAAGGYEDLCEVLLKRGARIKISAGGYGFTALHVAANPNLRVFEMLLEYGADVNAKSSAKFTPLHLVMSVDAVISLDVIRLLLAKGANVNAKAEADITPLHLAVIFLKDNGNHILAIRQLLEAGAEVNASDSGGDTPVHISAKRGNLGITRLLIANGASVDAKARDGATPLHRAIQSASGDVVRFLLELGAKDHRDPSLLVHAIKVSLWHEDGFGCLVYLLDEGFDPNTMINEQTPFVMALNLPKYVNSEAFYSTCLSLFAHDAQFNYLDLVRVRKMNDTRLGLFLALCPTVISGGEEIALGQLLDRLWPNPTSDVLARHLIKLEAIYEPKTTRSFLFSRAEELCGLGSFKDLCRQEVKSLRWSRISGSLINYYQVLVGAPEQVAAFARNKSMVHSLDLELITAQFPIYGRILYNKFQAGDTRNVLVEIGREGFIFLFNNLPQLPHVVVTNILSFFTNRDLLVLRKFRPTHD